MERGWNDEGRKPVIDQALRKRSIRIFEYTRFLYRVASQFLLEHDREFILLVYILIHSRITDGV